MPRPKLPITEKKTFVGIKIHPSLRKWLEKQPGSISRTMEQAIKEMKLKQERREARKAASES